MAVRKVSKEKEVRMATARGASTGSRILSERDISRPDLEIELNNQMASDFVKIEDHKKQIDAIQIALGARMRRSFIAGAIFGTLILVAIVMAGVGLRKVHKTAEVCLGKIEDNENAIRKDMGLYEKSNDLQVKLDELENRLNAKIGARVKTEELITKFFNMVTPEELKKELPTNCINACDAHPN